MNMNPKVDEYLIDGCGRCERAKTPDCKVNYWTEELKALRRLILGCGLVEELKWSHPCYTLDGANVVMLGAFNDNCVISFLKGVLLKDPAAILQAPGENTQSARVVRFTGLDEVRDLESILIEYVHEAMELERSGAKVEFKDISEHDVPEELQVRLDEMPEFREAFNSLTPGRRRGYLMYFSQPKQSKTREARIEKCTPAIMMGKGLHDR